MVKFQDDYALAVPPKMATEVSYKCCAPEFLGRTLHTAIMLLKRYCIIEKQISV